MFGQRKTPAADATSTLLNFLKQDRAMLNNSSTPAANKVPEQQVKVQGQAEQPGAAG
jgi:hypothetical protein